MVSIVFRFVVCEAHGSGKRSAISRSNKRNVMATRKNFMEKGRRAVSILHSNDRVAFLVDAPKGKLSVTLKEDLELGESKVARATGVDPFHIIRQVGQQLHDVAEDGVAVWMATDVAPAEYNGAHRLPTAEESVTELRYAVGDFHGCKNNVCVSVAAKLFFRNFAFKAFLFRQ